MLTSLVLAALTLTPAQPGELALTNARVTYGVLGPTRADTKFLPGDSLFVTFEIDGITADADGKVKYSVATEVTDAANKSIFRSPPRDLEAVNALGGNKLPAFAEVDLGLEQPAGDCTLKVTVTDRATKKSQTLTQKFTVLPANFGLVRLALTNDPEGREHAGTVHEVGDAVWISGVVVGFPRDKDKKQPHIDLEMRILDEQGKPTLAKPFAGTINKDVPANAGALPVQYLLSLNRAGKFTVEVKATCKICNASSTQTFPLAVLANK